MLDAEKFKRHAFGLGRSVLAATIMLYGLLMLADEGAEDVRAYYSAAQWVNPQGYGGHSEQDELRRFLAASQFYWFQRYLNMISLVLGGGMMLASDIKGIQGCLISILAMAYYALLYKNPVIPEAIGMPMKGSWLSFSRCLAIIGGLLVAMTRGKIQDEEQVVHVLRRPRPAPAKQLRS